MADSVIDDVEILTPFRIGLLSLVYLYCENLIEGEYLVELFAPLLKYFKLEPDHQPLEVLTSVFTKSKHQHLRQSYYQNFLAYYWSLRSVEELSSLLDSLSDCLVEDGDDSMNEDEDDDFLSLDPSTLVGSYVRSCVDTFARLDLNERMIVFRKLVDYRSTSYADAESFGVAGSHRSAHLEALNDAINLGSDLSKVTSRPEQDPYALRDATFEKLEFAKKNMDIHMSVITRYQLYGQSQLSHQEALLALGVTYSTITGNREEALQSAEEAIVVARRAKDIGTIIKTVTWLTILLKEHPEIKLPDSFGTKAQLWRYLINVSLELGTRFIKSVVSVMDMVNGLDAGESPVAVLEKLSRCLLLYPVLLDVHVDLELNFHIGQSMVWKRYGKGALAMGHDEITLNLLSASGKKVTESSIAVIRPILILQTGFEYGMTRQALDQIEDLRKVTHDSAESYSFWRPVQLLLKMHLYTKLLQFPKARAMLRILRSLTGINQITLQRINTCEVELLMAEGQNSAAYILAMKSYDLVHEQETDISFEIHYLILAARSLLTPSMSDTKALEALDLAERSYTFAIEASHVMLAYFAKALIARIYTTMGEYEKARRICEKIFPGVKATLMPWLISEANTVYATCILELYQQQKVDRNVLQRAFQRAQNALNVYDQCDFVALDRQLLELRQDVMRELDLPLLHSVQEIEDSDIRIKNLSSSSFIRPTYIRGGPDRSIIREGKRRQEQLERVPSKKIKSALFI